MAPAVLPAQPLAAPLPAQPPAAAAPLPAALASCPRPPPASAAAGWNGWGQLPELRAARAQRCRTRGRPSQWRGGG
eukprot:694553-Pelagomonas_calceolata.AAC.2